MGHPMATNLLRARVPLVVHTRTKARADDLVAAGAVWADDPATVAAKAETVITMLPDSPDVARVVRDGGGLFQARGRRITWIDMSSISPVVARELAAEAEAHEITALDAPVSGGEVGAINATLTIMVGGRKAVYQEHLPLLSLLGRASHVGDIGSGQVVKACNQLVVGATIAAVAEALSLGTAAGVDPERIRDALLGGFAHSRVLEVHGERMIRGAFEPGFRMRLHLKDLVNATDLAGRTHVSIPITATVAALMRTLVEDGTGELDHAALIRAYVPPNTE